jgi:hypothetical protein
LRQSAGIYLSSNASLACSSKLFAKENMTLGPSRELIEGGIFSINGMLNSSMSEKPRLISNAKVKISSDKFAGYKPNFTAYEKLFPISDIWFKSKLTDNPIEVVKLENGNDEETDIYTSLDEGVFTGPYSENGKTGFVLSDDSISLSFPSKVFSDGDIQYKFDVTTPFSVAKLSYFAVRAVAPFSNYSNRNPNEYHLYDIKLEDPSGNLIIQYEDIVIRGDNYYTTYISKPLVNNLLLPTWDINYPIMNEEDGYSLTINFKYVCNNSPFSDKFDLGYEDTCIINTDKLVDINNNPNAFYDLNISAIEIGNSGGVGILRDNYLNFFSQVTEEPNRISRKLFPSQVLAYNFKNGIYPEASSVWQTSFNDTLYNNITDSGAAYLLQQLRTDRHGEYIELINTTTFQDSGRLLLKFDTKPLYTATSKYIRGAFSFGIDSSFDDADLVEYPFNDEFFNVDKLELVIIAKKTPGGNNYPIDVVGYSNDRLLNVTSPVGGFIQNSGALVYNQASVPNISGYYSKNFSLSDTSLSDQSQYYDVDVTTKGDHYIVSSNIVDSTTFKEYTIPLEIYQNPNQLGYTNYSSSSLFEHLYLDISPLPSGAAIASVRLIVKYRPSNGLMLHTLGSPSNKNAIQKTISLFPINSGTIFSSSQISGIPVGLSSPSYLSSNFSRRWRGHTGDIFTGGDFKISNFDFSFNHVQSNTPFLSQYSDITNYSGQSLYSNSGLLIGSSSNNNLNVLSNFGLRYSSGQLFDTQTEYTSLSWLPNIFDNFDRALRTSGDYLSLNLMPSLDNSFALFFRYTPDKVSTYNLNNHLILSCDDLINTSSWAMSVVVENEYLKVKIKNQNQSVTTLSDSIKISQYSFPLPVLITYDETEGKLKLYTDNNLIPSFNNLRDYATVDPIASNISTFFGYSEYYNAQSTIPLFLHEIGYSDTCNIVESNPNRFINQITAQDLFNSYNVLASNVDDDISQWRLGDFKVCSFSADFNYFTKRIGRDYLTFYLNHPGTPYSQSTNKLLPSNINLSGIAYHTQIENDFIRFNISDIPAVDSGRFYALAPRISKTLPRGYQMHDSIYVETILEHDTYSTIKWSDNKLGPKMIVSLYANTQNIPDRPSKDFGLISRSYHHLEPSGCIRKITSKLNFDDLFDNSEPWATFDQETYLSEFKEKYFSRDIDNMFLQYDLVYPSGSSIKSTIKIHSTNIKLKDSIFFGENFANSLNIYASGEQKSLSSLNLVYEPVSGANPQNLNLCIFGDKFYSSGVCNLFVDSSGIFSQQSMNLYVSPISSIDSSYQNQLFGSLFGSAPIFGMSLYTSGQFMRESTLPLYTVINGIDYDNTLNLYAEAPIDLTTPFNIDVLNLNIRGTVASINTYSSSTMPLIVNVAEHPVLDSNSLILYVAGDDFTITPSSGSLSLFTINYPISSSLANSSASIVWNQDRVGTDIVASDNIYATVDSDDNIRGVDDLICYGTCSSINKCSEATVDIHGIKWYSPEICVDGGIFRAKNTYTNLSNNVSFSGISGFDYLPYSGHFYGIRKYTGLAPSLPYFVRITGKTGSTDPVEIPTEIVEVEYNKNPDDELIDYNGFRLLAGSSYQNSGDAFGKSIASKEDLLAIGTPMRDISYNDGINPSINLSEAGTVFLYRRNPRPSGVDWPLDNYKSQWLLEEALTLPSGMLRDYNVQSEIDIGLPFGLKPIQTQWYVGQEGRQFGHSVDLAINKDIKSLGEDFKQIAVVGGPSAKWTPRDFNDGDPSGVNIGLMIFTDEFIPFIPKPTRTGIVILSYEDVLRAIKDQDIVYSYFGDPRVKFNVKLIICQPIANDPNAQAPQYPDKPDFMTLSTISRNIGYIQDPNTISDMVEGMKSAFFEAFPYDESQIHNNIPPLLGVYVDDSSSLGRWSLEPAIDRFFDFYKNYSFASGLRDFYGVRDSGNIIEYIPEETESENWVDMSIKILTEVLDIDNLVSKNLSRFITGSVGKFDTSLNEFNLPPDSGGKVYIFEKESGNWNLIQEVKSPNITFAHPDRFGHAVSISDDTEVIAIGSPYISQAVTILENKPEEKDKLYNSIYDWVNSYRYDKYANQLLAYDQTANKTEAAKTLYLSLDKYDKFKSRLDLNIQEYQTIHKLDYSLMQPNGSWTFIPEAFAPTSRLGYSVDVNEDGSVVAVGSPTDSLNLFNDADVYYVAGSYNSTSYNATYSDPNNLIPNNINPAWQASVNAGSIHILESRKYYPHNKVIEYGRFGNLHELTSDNTPDSGHFNYLSGIFEDKNFTKTPFTQSELPKDAGLAFIITPAFDALTTSDEVFNNIYEWLSLGDRNLVLVGNDPVWEDGGKYRSSNNILNKLLERLKSRMRIIPARSSYESLPNGYTSFDNIIPSFVPQGSTSTFTQRLPVRGSGVGDIRIYFEGYEEHMPCQEVTLCDPEGEPIQLQSRCEMPLIHYGDLRAGWLDYCCKLTPKGELAPVIYSKNWPFVFGSFVPDCGNQNTESDNPLKNFEPIPLLVAAEQVSKEIIYPGVPEQFLDEIVYETVFSSSPEYFFGSPLDENVKFSWSIDETTDNYSNININVTNNQRGGAFYRPQYNGLLQAKAIPRVDINSYYEEVKVDDQANYCVEYNYNHSPNSSEDSKVIVIAGVITESRNALLTGVGDPNIKFYANLVSRSPVVRGTSNIAQLGAWTNRTKFTDGYSDSYLESVFRNNRNLVVQNVDTSFVSSSRQHLNNDFNVAWIANIESQPSDQELNDIKNWLSTGNKKLVITYDYNLTNFQEAQKFCQKLGINLEIVYIKNDESFYTRNSYGFEVNQSHPVAGNLINNKIEFFSANSSRPSFYPLKLNGGISLMYDSEPIFDRIIKNDINRYWSLDTGIAKLTLPVEAGSGYKVFITTESEAQSEYLPFKVVIDNASIHANLPHANIFYPTQIGQFDDNGQIDYSYTVSSGTLGLRLDSASTFEVDVQAQSGVDSINMYFYSDPSRIASSDFVPRTYKILGVSGVLLPIEQRINITETQIPTGEIKRTKIADAQSEIKENTQLIRPITTDNTKYCSTICKSKGLGGKEIEDGPMVVAQEIEILSPFNAGFARSRITVITDSSIVQGRYVANSNGTIPANTIAFIRSLYPETNFNTDNSGRQFNTYTKVISPQKGSPTKYYAYAPYSGINHYFGGSGTASLSTINQYESLYNPKYIKRPKVPWESETDEKKIQEIKNQFISGFYSHQFQHASAARFSGIVDGSLYVDANIGGGLPSILKDKGYDYLDLDKMPSGYPGDLFGYSLAVRGNKIIVGSPFSAFMTNDKNAWTSGSQLTLAYDGGAGAVFMFEKTGSGIDFDGKLTPWEFVRKFKPLSLMGQLSGINTRSDQFGHSVSMHNDAMIIGAPNHDYNNNVNMFFNDGAFARKNFNGQFDIPSRTVSDLGNYDIRSELEVDGILGNNAGAIYLYENKITDWENKLQDWKFIEKILPTSSNPNGERFGNTIYLSRPIRSDADYTVFAGCYNASGNNINTGASYAKDIMLRSQLPAFAESGAYLDAKVFGNRDENKDPTVRLIIKNNNENNATYYASGIIVANNRGEIFLEVSGQDPAPKGFISHRPYIESIIGQYQYGQLTENGMILYCSGMYVSPSANMPLFIDVENSAYVYNTLGLYNSAPLGSASNSGLYLFSSSPSGSSAASLNLCYASGIGNRNDNLYLYVRGK